MLGLAGVHQYSNQKGGNGLQSMRFHSTHSKAILKRCATKARNSSGIDEVAKRGKANLGPQ